MRSDDAVKIFPTGTVHSEMTLQRSNISKKQMQFNIDLLYDGNASKLHTITKIHITYTVEMELNM